MRKLLLLLTGVVLCMVPLFAQAPTKGETSFKRALTLMEEAQDRPEAAAEALALFSDAATSYEAAAVSDYRWWYEAGNARWWAQEAGAAIIDFRRYLVHNPFDARVWENLAEARKSAGTIPLSGERLGDWPWALWFLYAGAAGFGLALLGFGLFAWSRRRIWIRAGKAASALTVLFALSFGAYWILRPRVGVILTEIQGRKGDAAVYAAQPEEPWKRGQEAWIRGERDGWIEIQVGSSSSWVPSYTMEELGTSGLRP